MSTDRRAFRPGHLAWLALSGLAATALLLAGSVGVALQSDPWGAAPQRLVDACLLFSRSVATTTWSWVTHHPLGAFALAFLAGSMAWALARLAMALLRGGRLGRKLSAYEAGAFPPLDRALPLAPEVDPTQIGIIPSVTPEAFTVGLLRPKICLSQGLLQSLREPELQAVLRHEHAHARALDPLRLAAVRFLSDFLWFLPVSRPLADAFSGMAELRADEAAVAAGSDALELASALVRTARGVAAPRLAPALGGLALVEERVLRLLGQDPRLPITIRWGRGLASAVIIAALVGLLVNPASGTAIGNVPDRMAVMHSMMTGVLTDCARETAADPLPEHRPENCVSGMRGGSLGIHGDSGSVSYDGTSDGRS